MTAIREAMTRRILIVSGNLIGKERGGGREGYGVFLEVFVTLDLGCGV